MYNRQNQPDRKNSIHLVVVQGIDSEEHFVWADTTHLSYYLISDSTNWFDQWYVDWQKPSQVFRPDETIRIKANVHNIGDGTASNVNVKFYANNNLIGSSTISGIAAGRSSLTSVNRVVQSGVGSICPDFQRCSKKHDQATPSLYGLAKHKPLCYRFTSLFLTQRSVSFESE